MLNLTLGLLIGAVIAWMVRGARAERHQLESEQSAAEQHDDLATRLAVAHKQLNLRTARVAMVEDQLSGMEADLQQRATSCERLTRQLAEQGKDLLGARHRVGELEDEILMQRRRAHTLEGELGAAQSVLRRLREDYADHRIAHRYCSVTCPEPDASAPSAAPPTRTRQG